MQGARCGSRCQVLCSEAGCPLPLPLPMGAPAAKALDAPFPPRSRHQGNTCVKPWPRWEGGGRCVAGPAPAAPAALLRRVTAESTALEKAWLNPLMLVRVQPVVEWAEQVPASQQNEPWCKK